MNSFLKNYSGRILRCRLYVFLFLMLILGSYGCSNSQMGESMFDGKQLGHWKPADFFRNGSVYVKDGYMILEKSGAFLTGVTWDGPLVRMNYEISLEAMRLDGKDFFCGLTFPVDSNSCSLILSGWNGQNSGISSIDGLDASSNETTRHDTFVNNRWYKVRVRVTTGKIQAWVDNKPFVELNTTGKKIGIRSEVQPSVPLGIATYMSTGAIRKIRLTKLE
jgi:hypothetical protein